MQKLFSAILPVFLLLLSGHGGANDGGVRILILGDSLSAAHNIPVDQGWPRIFADNIGARYPEARVINASISGETTYGGLQRLPALLDQHLPTHLVIELGGNDGLRGLGFDQSTDNIRKMVSMASERGIEVLLIGVRMPPNFGAAYNARFQQVFETVSDEFDIAYLPRFLEGVAAADPALMQADGIHPTARAQPILAAKVEQRMLELLAR